MQGFSKQKIEIVLICVLAAIVYGIIHDEITAHLCVEYFTIAHPALFHTQSPAMLGLCWGVAATSGVGVTLGFCSPKFRTPKDCLPTLFSFSAVPFFIS